jgi:beta-lactam-binding protein with PASTA domain
VHLAWALETGLPGHHQPVPRAGSSLGTGGVVEIIASGPEPGTVAPDVLGRLSGDALARLEAAGLLVDVVIATGSGSALDPATLRVWAQVPAAGEPVEGLVTIWLSP